MAEAPHDSKIVALGDKFSNMSGIALDYRQIGDEVWKRFHAPNGKPDVEWYYRSLAEAMSELSDTLAYKEYLKLLEEVFGSEFCRYQQACHPCIGLVGKGKGSMPVETVKQ